MNPFLRTIPALALWFLINGLALAGAPVPPGMPIEPDEATVARMKQLELEAAHSPDAGYQLAMIQTELSNHSCGNGHQHELQQRIYNYWAAMASPETTDAQLDAIWRLLISGKVPSDGTLLFLIYQKVGLERIKGDLKRAKKMVPETEDTTHPYKRIAFDGISRSLHGRVATFEMYRTGSLEKLIAQHPHGVDDGLHGNLDKLADKQGLEPYQLWEPRVLIESLVIRKDDSLEPLLKVVGERESVRPTTLAALGTIGGDAAVSALKDLAKRQTNALDLRDTYYALLLCKDAKVVTYLQTPANTAHTPNAPAAAAWALKCQGHDVRLPVRETIGN